MQSRSRILVVDDDPMFRSLVVSLLRKEYLVSVAADGESALLKARTHRPDLVIIDYQMPGWDGVKTLAAFRGERTLAGVKVMMLTSDASKDTVLSAIKAGTDEYIIKTSFTKQDFLAKIRKLLGTIPALAAAQLPVEAVAVSGAAVEALAVEREVSAVHEPAQLAPAEVETMLEELLSDSLPQLISVTGEPVLHSLSEGALEEERLREILDEWE